MNIHTETQKKFRIATGLILLASVISGCSGSSDSTLIDNTAIGEVAENQASDVVALDAANQANSDVVDVAGDPVSNEVVVEVLNDDSELTSEESELAVVSDPVVDEVPQQVRASLELVQDKTFRITWQTTPGATQYRVLENPDGVSGFSDISGQLDDNASSFDHRVALFARVNAQYMVQSCNDQGCAYSEAVMTTGTLEDAIGYFKASNTGRNDIFGGDISLSADGNTLAIGAVGEDSSATGINGDQGDFEDGGFFNINSGAVYVFVRRDGLWQQQAYLKASNTERFDEFGGSVSLSADGNTLVVGAEGESSAAIGVNGDQGDNTAVSSGAAYVFSRSGESWQQRAYLKASNTEEDDRFGGVVSLSGDGNTLVVGAEGEDSATSGINGGINGDQSDNQSENSGAVYVFVRSGDVWQQQAYLKALNTSSLALFGDAISISADGNILAVGAKQESSGATGIDGDPSGGSAERSGAVYVYIRSDQQWRHQTYIKASNTERLDQFGAVVSLSGDGNTLAVGALFEDSGATGINGDQTDNSAIDAGAVYVYIRNGDQWQRQAYLKASNAEAGDFFGSDLSLSQDGNSLAVGALSEDSFSIGINSIYEYDNAVSTAGAAYIYIRQDGLWQQQAYIKASNTEVASGFGGALSLSGDGGTLAVGASEDSSATGINGDQSDDQFFGAGAVYLY